MDLQQEEPLGLHDSNSVFPIRHFFMRLAAIGEKKMHKCHEKSVNMNARLQVKQHKVRKLQMQNCIYKNIKNVLTLCDTDDIISKLTRGTH